MSVTIVKKKVQDVTKISSEDVVPATTVDEFAELHGEYKDAKEEIAPLEKKYKKMELGIIGAVDEVIDAGVKYTLVGNEYELQLGAQGVRAAVTSNEEVIDEIGIELFQKIAKVSMTDLKAYCTPEQLEKITKKSFAIKRRVKVEKI